MSILLNDIRPVPVLDGIRPRLESRSDLVACVEEGQHFPVRGRVVEAVGVETVPPSNNDIHVHVHVHVHFVPPRCVRVVARHTRV